MAVDAMEGQTDAWQAALAIMRFVHDRMAYEPQTTHVHTHAREALAAGRGVCQDFAHVMIGLCRAAQIPARYVSGYLATQRASGTHAWTEVFIPSVGWVALDPDAQFTTRRNLREDRHGARLQRCPPVARHLSRHAGEDNGSRR